MLKGFKDFLMRGNVIDLAVAVVIGTAFTAIVTAFTESLVQPVINALGGPGKADGLGFRILGANESTFVDIGNLINAMINFLLIAAVVYFLFVLPLRRVQQRRKRGEEAGPAQPTDIELLTEIRDLLREQRGGQRVGE